MRKNDFDILIGVNLENAESSIKSMIDEISKSYPIKLKVVLDSDSQVSKQLNSILGLLNKIESTELNIDSKGIKNLESSAKKVGKDVQESMDKASKEAKEFEKSMKESLNSLDRMSKLSDKIKTDYRGEDPRTTITEVKGNDFHTRTTKHSIGMDESGRVVKSLDVEEVANNYKKLNKEIDNVIAGLKKIKDNGNIATKEIEELEKEVRNLGNIDMSTESFDKSLNSVRTKYTEMIERDKNATVEKLDREQAIAKIEQQKVVWASKIEELERKGYTNYKQMQSLKMRLNKLNKEDLKTLEQVNKHLQGMNEQYKRAEAFQRSRKFKVDVVRQSKEQEQRAKKLDPELVGIENYNQLIAMTKRIADSENMEQLNNSLSKTVKLYDELISRQKTSIELLKLNNKYNEQLGNIEYKVSTKNLNEDHQAEVMSKIAEIQEQINVYKNRGIDLNEQERQSLKNNVIELNQMIDRFSRLESEEERVSRKTQELKEKFESFSYRASRGLDRNIKELAEIEQIQEKIQKRLQTDLVGLKGKDFDNAYRSIERDMLNMAQRSRELRDEIRKDNASFTGRFRHAMKQVPVWITAMGLFYGSVRQVRQGFESLVEIDSAMINLQKVSEATGEELERFKGIASEIGKTLGVTTAEVITATTEFQKLGYTLQEATALGRETVLYANVGDIDIETATQSIVSAVKGFDVAVDGSGRSIRKIVDIFNEVSNNYAITAEGIGVALQRSSAVLTQAGNSIEEAVALVTAANTTIQNPMRVGNALKTISMRLRGVSEDGKDSAKLVADLEEAFNSFGATIMENEDTFKSTYDIMDTLAKNWDNLTDLQRAHMTELIGGKEQGAIVASMVQNWKDAVGSLEAGLNSAGSAQREFLNYTESFEYKINRLVVSIEEFWMTLVDDDTAKAFIDLLTQMVQLATAFTETFGSETLLANMLAIFGLLTGRGLRRAVLKPDELKDRMKGVKEETDKADSSFKKLNGTLMGLGSIIGFLLKRLGGFFGIVTAIGFVTSAVVDAFSGKIGETQNRIKELEDEITAYERLNDVMEKIDINKFLSLQKRAESGQLNVEEYQELNDLQGKIREQLPELVSYYDEFGNAVFRSAEEVRDLIEEQEKLYNLNKKELLEIKISDTDFSELESEIRKIRKAEKDVFISENETQAYSFAREWIEDNKEAIEKGGDELLSKLQELSKKFNDSISDENFNKQQISLNFANEIGLRLRDGDADGALKYLDDYIAKLNTRTMKLGKEVENSKKDISVKMFEFNDLLQSQIEVIATDLGVKTGTNEYLFIEQIRDGIQENVTELGEDATEILNKVPEYIQEAFEVLEKAEINVNDLFIIREGDTEESIRKRFDEISNVLKDLGLDTTVHLTSAFNELKGTQLDNFFRKTADETISLSMAIQKTRSGIVSATNEYQNAVRGLDSAYKQLAEGQELSSFQILDLIGNYPELTKHLEVHNGAIKISQDAIMELAKVKEKEFKRDLEIKKTQALEAKKKAEAEIKEILREAKAHKLLNDLKTKSAKQAIEPELAEARRKMFSASDVKERMKGLSELEQLVETRKILEGLEELNGEINAIEKLLSTDFSSSLGNLSGGVKNSSKSLQDAIYVADEYNLTMNRLNATISKLQAIQERYPSYSKQYINAVNQEIEATKQKKRAIDAEIASLQKQINTRKIEQKGLISISKEDNKTARARHAEIQQQIDNARSELWNLQSEAEQVQNRILELNYNLISANRFYYENQRKSLDDDIEYVEYSMELYREGSNAFNTYAQEKMKYLKTLKTFHEQELEYLEREKIANKDLTASQRVELNAMIREARIAVTSARKEIREFQQELDEIEIKSVVEKFDREAKDYANAIEDIRNQIEYDIGEESYPEQIEAMRRILSLTKGQNSAIKRNIAQLEQMRERYKDNHELVKMITDELEDWREELRDSNTEIKSVNKEIKNMYQDLADEIVDIYKEQLELIREAEEKHFEESKRKHDKAHKDRIDALRRELEMLRKIYNEKIEMIEREESTRTFNRDIDEMRKEADELQKSINRLSMDDSFEALSKRSELEKQLAKVNMEIAERQHQREIELRKQSLEDDLKAEEERIEGLIDEYERDYQKFSENEEKKRKKRLEELENQINDERKFAKIREQVMEGNFENLADLLRGWSDEVSGEMSYLGEVITRNFTMKVEDAIRSLTALKNFNIGSFSSIGLVEETTINDYNPSETAKSGGNKLSEADYKLLAGKFLTDELTKYITRSSQGTELRKKAHELADEARSSGSTLDPDKSKGFNEVFKELTDEEKVLFAKYMREYILQIIKSPELINALKDITDEIASTARASIGNSSLWSSSSFLESLSKYLTGFSSGGYIGKTRRGSALVKVHDEELIIDKHNTQSLKEFLGTDNIGNAISKKIKDIINIDNVAKNLSNLFKAPTLTPVIEGGSGEVVQHTEEYNIDIFIENMNGDRDSVDLFSDQVVTKLKKSRGGRFY